MKHRNLSIFVPHAGCPERCIFCDQRAISGEEELPGATSVADLCERQLPADKETAENTEIAFFGGSFTAIEHGYMVELLEAAHRFVKAGRAAGIRISTRPDAIDQLTLDVLKFYGVTAIELGAQSTDDLVLMDNMRGHTFRDIVNASSLIRQNGFSLGLQMMAGMYGETDARLSALKTARDFIGLRAETVRIYPALVLRHTKLEYLYHVGAYTPLSVEEAADIAGELLLLFDQNSVNVIRTGLHADELLEHSVVAGPHHPAFGELAEASAYKRLIAAALSERRPGSYRVLVARGRLSAAAGQRKSNIAYFANQGYSLIIVEADGLSRFGLVVEEENQRQ